MRIVSSMTTAVAVALLVTGCSGTGESGTGESGSVESEPGSTPTPPPTTSPTVPSNELAAPVCRTQHIEITLKTDEAADTAGSVHNHLIFTNIGGEDCLLYGWPTVYYVKDDDGDQIGAAAEHTGQPRPVTLGSDESGTAELTEKIAKNLDDTCETTTAVGFWVVPPKTEGGGFVRHATEVCASKSVQLLTVGPVVHQ